jgi:hypothetical protein
MNYYNTEACKRLANELGVKDAFLFSCIKLAKNPAQYKVLIIDKKGGGKRTIIEPPEKIKTIQRRIVDFLKTKQHEKYCAYGFVKGKNNVMNAKIHVGQNYIYKIDLKDYFPSIKAGRIYKMLITKPFSFSICYAAVITNLLCHMGRLYQGAPSSPFIANIVTRKLDNALLILSKEHYCRYSRYADDITFSTHLSEFPMEIMNKMKSIVEKEMFIINEKKTKLQSKKKRQIVTGIVVNKKPNLKRDYYKDLRAKLYTWSKTGLDACSQRNNMTREKFPKYILGKIAYYKSVVGEDNNCYMRICALYNNAVGASHFRNISLVYKLSNSTYLLSQGQYQAAGNDCALVLDKFLQDICSKHAVKTPKRPTISEYNEALRTSSIIDIPKWRLIQSIADTRNNYCAHNNAQQPNSVQIEKMITDTKYIIQNVT